LSAVPIPDPKTERKRKRVILTGDVPSPVNPPPGCRFHTRCWLYERLGRPDVCRTEEPELLQVRPEHFAACHFAEDALRSDIGVAHLDETAQPAAGAAAAATA
jgi:oligopeptide/dipeptide ABC transporter ATP-binding protein